jgi:hypothetical protein
MKKLKGKGTKAILALAVSAASTAGKPYDGMEIGAAPENSHKPSKLGIFRHSREKVSVLSVATSLSSDR